MPPHACRVNEACKVGCGVVEGGEGEVVGR